MHLEILIAILLYVSVVDGLAQNECGSCVPDKGANGCSHDQPVPMSNHSSGNPPPQLLSERGYCLAGDYDILVSRHPLFNMSIKDQSKCVSYLDYDRTQKFVSPSSNFASFRYYPLSRPLKTTFQFKILNIFPSVWDAYLDFRRRSSITVNSSTTYNDLHATLDNIGSGKESIFQLYYKRFQRVLFDKQVPFYHLRAQAILGEFEMKKSLIDQNDLHFSSQFVDYLHQNILPNVENETSLWDDKFFLLFGTHYVRRGLFGGYIDLIFTPWDTVCEVPPAMNLSAFATCTSAKLNRKFGLGRRRDTARAKMEEDEACKGFSFWMLNDQDALSVISGSDYDLQVAVSIAVRYPLYADAIDQPMMKGWLRSLYDAPSLVEGTLEPICELFPEAGNLKSSCEWNLLRYLKNNEPMLRAPSHDQTEECTKDATLVAFDSGFNVLRNGCISTVRSDVLCPDQMGESELTTPAANLAITKMGQISYVACSLCYFTLCYLQLR